MKTLSNQYKLIKEGKGSKDGFLRNAKRQFPNHVPNHATYDQAANILRQKGIISENFVGTQMIGGYAKPEKQGYEKAFENFLKEAEAKAEEKKVTKEVEEDLAKTYDYKDEKNPDNMIFGQIQMGVYYEARLDKNEGKTLDEIKDIVFKNLAKDPIHYTKTGQFGVEVGYTDDAPSLGPTDEPKGKYKSSGYGNLKENKEPVNEIAIAGGLVTGKGFTSVNYKDFFGLNEETVEEVDFTKLDKKIQDDPDFLKRVTNAQKAAETGKSDELIDIMTNLEEDKAPAGLDRLIDVAEEIFDDGAGMSLRSLGELLDDVKKHMASKYGE